MISSLFIGLLVGACAKPIAREACNRTNQSSRIPLSPFEFKPSVEFMSKPNRTADLLQSETMFAFVPEITESVDKEHYTINYTFPEFVDPKSMTFFTMNLWNHFFFNINGSTKDGVIGFKYRKILPDYLKLNVKWEYNNKTEVKLIIPVVAPIAPFTNRLLHSQAKIEGGNFIISTFLPGLSKDDIYLGTYDQYFFVIAFKKKLISYEETRAWPPGATKEYQWEYKQDVLTVWMTLDEKCK